MHEHSKEEILLSSTIFQSYIKSKCLLEIVVVPVGAASESSINNSGGSQQHSLDSSCASKISIVVGPQHLTQQRQEISLLKELCEIAPELFRESTQIKLRKIIHLDDLVPKP